MDAMGKCALLDAWTLMLQDRADEVAAPEGGGHNDPLVTLGTVPTEPYVLADHVLSLPAMAVYAVLNIGSFLRTHENRMMRIPAAFVARLRAQADADIAGMANHPDKPAFVSEGDIVCAWWACLATKHLLPPHSDTNSRSNRTVTINSAMSLRNCLAGDLFSSTAPGGRVSYVSNATSFVFTRLTLGALNTQPLGVTAAAIRCALDAQRARPQIEAYAALWRAAPGKLPPLVGDSSMHMLTFSNWCKANLYETDLSAAVVSNSGSSSSRIGRPSYLQNNQFGLVLPDGFPVIGKDLDGHVWLSGYMNPGVWASIEAELATT